MVHNQDVLLDLVDERPQDTPLITLCNHQSCMDDPHIAGRRSIRYLVFNNKIMALTKKYSFKGVVDCFFVLFLGLIVFMECSLTLMLRLKKANIIFHIIYLCSTPHCPFSYKRSDDFLVL